MSGLITGIAGVAIAGAGLGNQIIQGNKASSQQNSAAASQGLDAQIQRYLADQEREEAMRKLQQQYNEQAPQRQEARDRYIEGIDKSMDFAGNQLAQMRQLASQGIPDAVRAAVERDAQRSVSQQVASAESARGSLGAASRGNQQMLDTYTDLAAMDAQQTIANRQMAAMAEGQYGQALNASEAARLGAEQDYMNWEQQAYTQAYIDPQMATAAMLYGQGNRSLDYAAALQGASMQNQQNMWNQVGQTSGQLGGYLAGYGFSNYSPSGGRNRSANINQNTQKATDRNTQATGYTGTA